MQQKKKIGQREEKLRTKHEDVFIIQSRCLTGRGGLVDD
jgi:hypothetical protein